MLVDYLLGQAIPPDPELASLVNRIAGQATADRATIAPSATDRAPFGLLTLWQSSPPSGMIRRQRVALESLNPGPDC